MKKIIYKIKSIYKIMRSDLFAVVSINADGIMVESFLPDSMAEPILDACRDIWIDLEREAERVES